MQTVWHTSRFAVLITWLNGIMSMVLYHLWVATPLIHSALNCLRSFVRVVPCVSDVSTNPDLSPAQRSAYTAIQNAAHIGIPLVKGNQFVAGLAVHSSEPRDWTEEEVALAEEVAE